MRALVLLLALPSLCMAKQPNLEETGPPIYRYEERWIHDRQWLGWPAAVDVRGEVAMYVLPGGWNWVIPDQWTGRPPYFERWRNTTWRTPRALPIGYESYGTEVISIQEVIELGGLPW